MSNQEKSAIKKEKKIKKQNETQNSTDQSALTANKQANASKNKPQTEGKSIEQSNTKTTSQQSTLHHNDSSKSLKSIASSSSLSFSSANMSQQTNTATPASTSNVIASALTNTTTVSNAGKEFSTAPDTIQLKRKKNLYDTHSNSSNSFKLFNHLQYQCDYSLIEKQPFDNPSIHPAFIKLGLQYANQVVSGSNSRCIAFLHAFREFVKDYNKSNKHEIEIGKDIESKLKPNINFLAQCRPLSVSMGNAIKEFKQRLLQFPSDASENEIKEAIITEIEKFVEERIELADQTISKYMLANEDIVISGSSYAKSKLTNDDCILLYGSSSVAIRVLKDAYKRFPYLKVIIVDSRPKYTGKATLEKLSKIGIDCTYILINAVSFVMKRVTKVIIGAHALLANGYVMGSVGASQIALIAKAFNVPVVTCCETYKFCDKVQTDVFVNNELGNPDELKRDKFNNILSYLNNEENTNNSSSSNDNKNINIINLTYDVTPPDLISCVVTDMGMLPCTSVPVVLRVKNRDNINMIHHSNHNSVLNTMSVESESKNLSENEYILSCKNKLSKWLNHYMRVKITDGRVLIGIFLCTDANQNIILGQCQEFVNSTQNSEDSRPLGLAMVPGHHITSIDVDESAII